MGSLGEKELEIINQDQETDPETTTMDTLIVITEPLTTPKVVYKYQKWLEVGVHAFVVLASQTVATILAKLYYQKGGHSSWLISLTETVGFPILLIPMILWPDKKKPTLEEGNSICDDSKPPSIMAKLVIYIFLGFLVGGGCSLFSTGLLYLPASTVSLISSSQLVFNVLFSLCMRLVKLTPLIANSIVLITISSVLLALQNDESSSKTSSSKHHYAVGFVCTLTAAAGFGLLFSTTNLMLKKVLKKKTLREIMDVIICQSFVATCLILIGLFVSKEWRNLNSEMHNFELGELSYVMILFWISVCWQLYTYSILGLIMKVSAVFANVIAALGAPVIPIMSVIIFNDEMRGVKAVSIVLSIWGFSSYAYQQYLDEQKNKAGVLKNCNGTSEDLGIESG
ncbi:putative LRR receptor-like serine/threonine-protein kinase FLS2-like [Capsicum annuum]|nr:putative LRR receptor-like serine/threonine-protein kinase FLS2-like [Capsicum annuum]